MATLTISGTGGTITLQITPATSGKRSPPPFEQEIKEERAIVTHPIPNRDGNRKQDMGRDDATVRLRGKCLVAERNTIETIIRTKQLPSSGITITHTDDDGANVYTSPAMILKSAMWGPRSGEPKWYNFDLFFLEKNQ